MKKEKKNEERQEKEKEKKTSNILHHGNIFAWRPYMPIPLYLNAHSKLCHTGGRENGALNVRFAAKFQHFIYIIYVTGYM